MTQLAGAEKLLDHRRYRLGVDQIMGHQRLNLLQTHAFLYSPLHPDQPDAVLIFQEFSHRTHPAIPQVIDVVDCSLAVLDLYEAFHRPEDVVFAKGAVAEW